jgi:cobalt-precorrin 5A hydrolase
MNGGAKTALVAITKHGCTLALAAARELEDARVFAPDKFTPALLELGERFSPYKGPSREQIGPLFKHFDIIVFFFSIGAVVRLVAPHLGDKETDPGVLAVDDAGRYVVPVLSGHIGGANAFAGKLASILNAQAIITTASEARGTIAVDILGRELGWRVEATKPLLTRAAAAMVNEEPLALVQETGSREWWPAGRPLPANIRSFGFLEEIKDPEKYKAILWISNRNLPHGMEHMQERLVTYRVPHTGRVPHMGEKGGKA